MTIDKSLTNVYSKLNKISDHIYAANVNLYCYFDCFWLCVCYCKVNFIISHIISKNKFLLKFAVFT